MINTQLEGLVKLVLDAFAEGVPSADEYRKTAFELQLRRKLMERYCNDTQTTTSHTYKITAGTPMGTWTTRECPPSTSQLLNG